MTPTEPPRVRSVYGSAWRRLILAATVLLALGPCRDATAAESDRQRTANVCDLQMPAADGARPVVAPDPSSGASEAAITSPNPRSSSVCVLDSPGASGNDPAVGVAPPPTPRAPPTRP